MNYISRFILWTGLCSVLLTAVGCRKHDPFDSAALEKKYPLVDAMLILHCNEMQTKADPLHTAQECQINDLNLFFVHKAYPSPSEPEVRHYYFSSADMDKHIKLTNIRLGEYRLYAVANAGKSLCPETSHDPTEAPADLDVASCSMTEAQIKALVVGKKENDLTRADDLLMSSVGTDPNNPYCDEVAIKRGDEGVLPTFTINLMRRVAKVELSYELFGDAVGKLTINNISAQTVPQYNISLFGKEGNRPTSADNINTSVRNIVNTSQTGDMTVPVIFYLPENKQGNVEGINSEQERNALNAPEYASYLFLNGMYKEDPSMLGDGDQYGFSVYFGDDMKGGNFDLIGNAYYRMHLKVGGPDPNDIRISSLKIDVPKHFDNQLDVPGETYAEIELTCSNYFNDQVKLICSTAGSTGVSSFRVYPLNDDGSLGPELPNQAEMGFGFMILDNTEDEQGTIKRKFKVVYSQTSLGFGDTNTRISFMLTTRFGATTFHDHQLYIYD